MSNDHDVNTGPGTAFALDEPALGAWLREQLGADLKLQRVEKFRGGQSNPTYRLETSRGPLVLRRKPPGALLASAHAVDREYRVLAALANTDVPVPRVHGLCRDDGVIGSWFYVMEHVTGRIFWDSSFPDQPRAERSRYFDAMNDALARLHLVDYQAVGLADFGKPDNYVARQVARWSKQYQSDTAAGRVPAMDRLIDWLGRWRPAQETPAIVHGDYRCDNLMYHPVEPRVIAILDWELATIGDAAADFANHLMIYRLPSGAIPGLLGKDPVALGLPTEAEYIEAYCRRTGRAGIADIDSYLAFSLFRLAAIFHGIRGRVLRGTAASAQAREYAQHVETLADLAWAQAERAMRR